MKYVDTVLEFLAEHRSFRWFLTGLAVGLLVWASF